MISRKRSFLLYLFLAGVIGLGTFVFLSYERLGQRFTQSPGEAARITTAGDASPASFMPQYASTREDRMVLAKIRQILARGKALDAALEFKELYARSGFPAESFGVAVTLYQPGRTRILVVRIGESAFENLRKLLQSALQHPRLGEFDFTDTENCRIRLDFIIEPPARVNLHSLQQDKLDQDRFEMGVDGLRMEDGKSARYFLPGDAFTKSILTLRQLRRHLRRLWGTTPFKDVIFERLRSVSFVSYGDDWLRLYRGYPVPGPLQKEDLERAAEAGSHHAMKNQKEDGRFLYYYDPAGNTFRDHQHPKRNEDNLYYNILRHAGGGLLLLYNYKYTQNTGALEHARRAADYLVKQVRTYRGPNGRTAGYVYYNRKAKLGGSGIALYFLAEYQHLTGDTTYEHVAHALKEHLLNQILDSGEFIYYSLYLDKPVTERNNARYFSFYYPGEALIGLATYYKYIETNAREKRRLRDKMHQALKFLFVDRPKSHAKHYKSLPSDSWLMMAVNELWDIPKMRRDLYKNAVFKDADQMVDHMYTIENAPYPDYAGAFYYDYGDFPYADGARSEGLLGAFELAVKLKDGPRIKKYGDALKLAAWAQLHLINTPQSVYSVDNPELTIGGIRFKHTRQWFRIDTIQHVAAFFLKFLPYWI